MKKSRVVPAKQQRKLSPAHAPRYCQQRGGSWVLLAVPAGLLATCAAAFPLVCRAGERGIGTSLGLGLIGLLEFGNSTNAQVWERRQDHMG